MVATGDFQTDSWNTYLAIHEVLRDPLTTPEAREFHSNLLTGLLHDNDFAGQLWSHTREHAPELFDAVQREVARATSTPLAEGAYDAAQEHIALLREGELDGLTVITPQEETPAVAPAEEVIEPLGELPEAALTANTINLTEAELLEIHAALSDVNPDLLRLASVDTRFIGSQIGAYLVAQEAYATAQGSDNPEAIPPAQDELFSARLGLEFAVDEFYSAAVTTAVLSQARNITQGLHPDSGQPMEYVEINGSDYFMEADRAAETYAALAEVSPEVTAALDTTATVVEAAPTPSPHAEETDVVTAEVTEISAPDAIDLSATQLDAFWNAEANFRLASLDPSDDGIGLHTYTHVVGDPRYVGYFDQYVAANGLVGPEIDALRAEVVAAHQDAAATLETIEYDGLQMAYHGSSQDFYIIIETENYSALGEGYAAPAETNMFTGLGVTQPLAPDVLTEIQAPLEPVRPDVFPTVIVVSPDDAIDIQQPSFLSSLGSIFVGSAHADTLPADMDTSPAEPLAAPEAVVNDGIAPVQLSYSEEITTSGGITEFTTSERLTFGAITEGATGTDPLAVSFDTAQFLATAAAEAEATSTPYTTLQTDTSLTEIMHDHYNIEDPGMAYRAALIVAAANDSITNPDDVPTGTPLLLPSMEVLREAAGSDTLRLRNLTSAPAEIGAQVQEAMATDTPTATVTPQPVMALGS